MTDAAIKATFRKPFTEQVAAFRLRLRDLVATSTWTDVSRSAHDSSFMVAGAVKADLLADLGAAVERAISEGTGFEAFKRDFRDIVERRGWHGWTGEGTPKGENWRIRTIYRTNMRTSYMAGRFAQLREGGFKYWVYRHGGSLEPREQHLGWDGLILPADHPFWETHYPPNGWGCSCRVFGARSIEGAKRRGGKPSVKLQDGWDVRDRRTGAPPGVQKAWDYAPGASVEGTIRAMTEKTVNWPFALARAFMDDVPAELQDQFSRAYRDLTSLRTSLRQFAQSVQDGRANVLPRTLGRLSSDHRRQIDGDLDGYQFVLDASSVGHVLGNHGTGETARGQVDLSVTDIARLPSVLNRPDAIEDAGTNGRGQRIVRFVKSIGGVQFTAAFEIRGRRRRQLALVSMWGRRVR